MVIRLRQCELSMVEEDKYLSVTFKLYFFSTLRAVNSSDLLIIIL